MGKTAEELIAFGNQQAQQAETWRGTAERIGQFHSPTPPNIQQPPAQQQPQGQQYDPADLVTMGQLNDYSQRFAQQVAQSAQQAPMEAMAQLAWREVQKEAPEVFDKFPQEALEFWSKLPLAQRNLDGARTVVNLVRGNHFKELAAAVAPPPVQGDATFRSSGGPAPGGSTTGGPGSGALYNAFDDPKVPEDWKAKARARNVTMDQVWEFAKASGLSAEEYAKKYLHRAVAG